MRVCGVAESARIRRRLTFPDEAYQGASAVPPGTDTPDAEAWKHGTRGRPASCRSHGAAPRLLTAARAHGAGATSRADAGRPRPPAGRRVGHEVASASVSSHGGGSRRRSSTWSLSWHGTPAAFPSRQNGRSPIACGSPLDRRCGRSLGACPATRRLTQPMAWPRRPGTFHPPTRSLSFSLA